MNKILYVDSGTERTQEMSKILMELPVIKKAQLNILHVVSTPMTIDASVSKWEEQGKIVSILENFKLEPNKISSTLSQEQPKGAVCQVTDGDQCRFN